MDGAGNGWARLLSNGEGGVRFPDRREKGLWKSMVCLIEGELSR